MKLARSSTFKAILWAIILAPIWSIPNYQVLQFFKGKDVLKDFLVGNKNLLGFWSDPDFCFIAPILALFLLLRHFFIILEQKRVGALTWKAAFIEHSRKSKLRSFLIVLLCLYLANYRIATCFNVFENEKLTFGAMGKYMVISNPSFLRYRYYTNDQWKNGMTLLHLAAASNNFFLADACLWVKADINPRTAMGYLPIQLATLNGNARMVRLLLSNGAKEDHKFRKEKVPGT